MSQNRKSFFRTIFLISAGLVAAIMLSSCGKVSNEISVFFKGQHDFQKSEIISNGSAVADGQSELIMVVHLMNSDNTEIKNFKPDYEVLSGSGVIPSECTTSNINGLSFCILKATQPGIKKVSVTNVKVKLEADLLFKTPTGKALNGLISSARKQNSGSYSLSATVGNQEPGVVRTSGTYKLYGGVQGEAFSR